MLTRSSPLLVRLCFYYRRVGFLPLPEKKETGGEDAFLSTSSVQAVLDGVSWWRDNAQVDAGLYSAAVARGMYDYIEDDLLGDVPASSFRLFEKGYEDGKHSQVQGTCTALVATLQEPQPDIHAKDGYTYPELENEPILSEEEQAALLATVSTARNGGYSSAQRGTSSNSSDSHGGAEQEDAGSGGASPASELAENHLLDVVFIGDCSLMVLREGHILYVSEEQQHDLDYPYQIGTGSNDTPSDGVRLLIPVQRGDIVIMGSDGIFDNLYPKHIAKLVWSTVAPVYKASGYPSFSPNTSQHSRKQLNKLVDEMMSALQLSTEKVLEAATVFSKDIRSDTPYASKCIEGGALYEGGKPDDMTVLISVIGDEDDGSSGERFSGSDTVYPVPYRDWP